MIISIGSSLPTFKPLDFHPGLNVLLADITDGSTTRQTRNSAGKTSLAEIIHFLLGGDADKSSLFKKPELIEHTFFGIIELGGGKLKIARRGAHDKAVFVESVPPSAPLPFEVMTDLGGASFISLDRWKEILAEVWFKIPAERTGTPFDISYGPSARSILNYMVRRKRIGGFSSLEKQNSDQQPGDWQVNLAFILGLDWEVAREFQELRARRKALSGLSKAIKQGDLGRIFGSTAEIRPEVTRIEQQMAALRKEVDAFRVHEQYEQLADRAAILKQYMSELSVRLASLEEEVAYLKSSMEVEQAPPLLAIEAVYRAAGIELPEMALRRFDQVKAFQVSVTANRKGYLAEQLAVAENRAALTRRDIRDADHDRASILTELEGKGAFEDLIRLRERLGSLAGRAETLRGRLQSAAALENDVAQLKLESAELELKLQESLSRTEDAIRDATVLVDEAINRLYDDRTGNLIIEAGKSGPNFHIEIQGGGNKGGIDLMKIYCFDMMLFQFITKRFAPDAPDFIVHDSHIFDGVDTRQIRSALMFGKEVAERTNGQYVVTLNSDEFRSTGLADDPDFDGVVLPTVLTDDEKGGLFGFRFD